MIRYYLITITLRVLMKKTWNKAFTDGAASCIFTLTRLKLNDDRIIREILFFYASVKKIGMYEQKKAKMSRKTPDYLAS